MSTGSQFGVSCDQLVELMGERGKEAEANLLEYGGVEGLAYHLKTNLKLGVSDDPLELKARRREYGVNFFPPAPAESLTSFLRLAFEALKVRGEAGKGGGVGPGPQRSSNANGCPLLHGSS